MDLRMLSRVNVAEQARAVGFSPLKVEMLQWRLRMRDRKWWWCELAGLVVFVMLVEEMAIVVTDYRVSIPLAVATAFMWDPVQGILLNWWERWRVRRATVLVASFEVRLRDEPGSPEERTERPE